MPAWERVAVVAVAGLLLVALLLEWTSSGVRGWFVNHALTAGVVSGGLLLAPLLLVLERSLERREQERERLRQEAVTAELARAEQRELERWKRPARDALETFLFTADRLNPLTRETFLTGTHMHLEGASGDRVLRALAIRGGGSFLELDPDALDPDGSLSPVDQDDRAVEHVPRFRGLNYLTADRGERPRLRTPGLAYLDADADAPSVPTDPDRDRDSEERGGNRGEAESGIRGHAGMIARRADIGHG
jgi:hypothetical protein